MTPIQTPSIFAPVSTPAFAIRELSFIVLAITAAIFLIWVWHAPALYDLAVDSDLWHQTMFQSLPLAVILTFPDHVIYTRYSSLDDQALAGVIMWVPRSLPLLRLVVELSFRVSRHRGPSCLIRHREW